MQKKFYLYLSLCLFFTISCESHVNFERLGAFGFDIAGDIPASVDTVITTPVDGDSQDPDDPNAICDPLGGSGASSKNGIIGTLTYMDPIPASYPPSVNAFIPGQNGVLVVQNKVYLSSINKRTSEFTNGFADKNGGLLKKQSGEVLIEYFALFLKGEIQLTNLEEEGMYEFAILSDDGSLFYVNPSGTQQLIINNDGVHPNKMGCSAAISLTKSKNLPFELGWYQGPRTYISFMMFWRKASSSNPTEPFCGVSFGNRDFFLNDVAQAKYNEFISRGWKLLEPANFILPDGKTNPCN